MFASSSTLVARQTKSLSYVFCQHFTPVRIPCERAWHRTARTAKLNVRIQSGSPFREAETKRITPTDRQRLSIPSLHCCTEHVWSWRGYKVKYAVAGCGKPILLVHGFGASLCHWRFNIPELARQGHKVYAIDLLGLGGSEKPPLAYSMELWRDQIVDFVKEFMAGQDVVLVGNSIGSLACLMSNAALPAEQVRGTVLLNCAGAMNNKGVTKGDWRITLVYPVLLLIDALLSNPRIARYLFDKIRSRDNIADILRSVYSNKQAVDDELLDIILTPAEDPGALPVFVSVITGPPGPKPWDLIPESKGPLLILWGDEDPFTPLDGPVGKFFQALPAVRKEPTAFQILQGVGHCPHDDRPEVVHNYLLPWLEELDTGSTPASVMPVKTIC